MRLKKTEYKWELTRERKSCHVKTMPLLNMTRSGVMVSAEMAEVDIWTVLAHLDQKQRIDDLHSRD